MKFIALLALSFVPIAPISAQSSSFELLRDEVDPIVPNKVTHHVDEIFDDGELVEKYNFLVYEFETEEGFISARAYLDEIKTVALFGPYPDKNSQELISAPELEAATIGYLKRRYRKIERFLPDSNSATGYELIWTADPPRNATQDDLRTIENACELPTGALSGEASVENWKDQLICAIKEGQRRNLILGFVTNPVLSE
ncbi:hypothetical protein [Altererythrobacter sp.]|uniref:hypothetical protein n=1 Tax=Altererythrobacter sp. TaxID=1872480 RepID=UPI003D0D51DC